MKQRKSATVVAISAAFLALIHIQGADGFIRLSGSDPGDAADVQQQKPRLNRRMAPGFVLEEGQIKPDPKHTRANFDPEVAMHEIDPDLEYMGYGEEDYEHMFEEEDNEEYWGGFNVTERMIEIFPQIDQDGDGILILTELHDWHHSNGHAASLRRSERSFNHSDMDSDGKITLKEYLSEHFHKFLDMPEFPNKVERKPNPESTADYDHSYDDNGMELEMDIRDWQYAHEIKDRFGLADVDADGGLNLQEFHHFLHPEESDNSDLHHHVIKHEIRENDHDSDGQISLTEFQDGLWYMFHNTEEWDSEDTWDAERDAQLAEQWFQKIDADSDGFILMLELVPHYDKMFRNEKYYAGMQAKDIIGEADTDNDQKLTLAEMLENPNVFYSLTADQSSHYYDYHDYYYHDEF